MNAQVCSIKCVIVAGLFCIVYSANAATNLVMESWRSDDDIAWTDHILPVFEAIYPDINVLFKPTSSIRYDSSILRRGHNNRVGDIISCRPFSRSRVLFEKNILMGLDISTFSNIHKDSTTAWTSVDEKTLYCLPLSSVIHGFVYNKTYFDTHNFSEPETIEEFFDLLDLIKAEGSVIPLAVGTYDSWAVAELGFNNIGPSHWDGERGRRRLLSGQQSFKHPNWIAPFKNLRKWGDYMGDAYEYRTYADSVHLFVNGRAAIYPAGSWEISTLEKNAKFELAAFPPPKKNNLSPCIVTNHPDIGIGIYSNTKHREEALTFLNWLASDAFRQLYAKNLPGFFLFGKKIPNSSSKLSDIFRSWLNYCDSTERFNAQIDVAKYPNFEQYFWDTVTDVINGDITPEEASSVLDSQITQHSD